jgi:hypothetical protein
MAKLLGTGGEHSGQPVTSLGDSLEPLRAVVDGVQGGDVGQEGLRKDTRG